MPGRRGEKLERQTLNKVMSKESRNKTLTALTTSSLKWGKEE